jgi:hypothetical protein
MKQLAKQWYQANEDWKLNSFAHPTKFAGICAMKFPNFPIPKFQNQQDGNTQRR